MTKHLPLLGHRMTRIFSILLLIGLAWGQDKYPYFNDMGKQLEFERKKIVISDTKESRQIIKGGGSEFNWLSLISKYEPSYKIAPIKTEFEYVTFFSITRNGKKIGEIDFLNFVGLNAQADSLVKDFRRQLDLFSKDTSLVFDKDNYIVRKVMFYAPSALSGLMSFLLLNEDGYEKASFSSALISIGLLMGGKKTKKRKFMIKPKKTYPTITSFLTNEQVKSISEAYNRKLYRDISKK